MKNRYEVRGDTTAIFMNFKGRVVETLIDTSDLAKVNSHPNSWYVDGSSGENYMYATSHIRENGKRKRVALHRLLMDAPKELMVDHINHETLNNRRVNLRLVTSAENQQNAILRKDNKSSGKRNVSYCKTNKKWIVYININKKRVHIGTYDSADEANEIAKIARSKYMPFSPECDVESTSELVLKKNEPRRTKIHGDIRNISRNVKSKTWTVSYKKKYYGAYQDLDIAKYVLDQVKSGKFEYSKQAVKDIKNKSTLS